MSWLGLGATVLRSNVTAVINKLLRRILLENGDFILQENGDKILF